ncbi:MAG: hypothetical protein AAFR70_00880 [Pseudomonadota bacterium]
MTGDENEGPSNPNDPMGLRVGPFGATNGAPAGMGRGFAEQIVFPVDPITQEAARLADEVSRANAKSGETSFHRAARTAAARIAGTVAAEHRAAEIARLEAAFDELSDTVRVIVFFSAGETALAGQAIAQFAGWNIPGVGEKEQLKRPRTRLYDTFDPDTLLQVRDSLDFERAAFVFVPDRETPRTTVLQAHVFISALVDAVGREAAGPRIVCLIPGDQSDAASDLESAQAELISLVSSAGGTVHRLSAETPIANASLGVAALAPGVARGVNLREFDAGVLDIVAGFADATMPPPQLHLGWPALVGAVRGQDRRSDRATHLTLTTTSDRLARLVAWSASHMSTAELRIFASAIPQSVLGYNGDALGLDLADGALARIDQVALKLAPGPLISLIDVEPRPAAVYGEDGALYNRLYEAAGVWSDRFVANAVAQGRIVRRVTADLDSPFAYGQFIARILLDRQLLGPAVDAAD